MFINKQAVRFLYLWENKIEINKLSVKCGNTANTEDNKKLFLFRLLLLLHFKNILNI